MSPAFILRKYVEEAEEIAGIWCQFWSEVIGTEQAELKGRKNRWLIWIRQKPQYMRH